MRDPLAWVPVRYKLPLTFVFFCLVAFGVGGYIVTTTASDSLHEQIRLRLDDRADDLNRAVEQSLELLQRRVEDFASDGYIRVQLDRLTGNFPDAQVPEAAKQDLIRHLRENKLPLADEFVEALLLNADGEPVLSAMNLIVSAPEQYDPDSFWVGPIRAADAQFAWPTFILSTPVSSLDGARRLGFFQIVVRGDVWASSFGGAFKFAGASGFQAQLRSEEGQTLSLVAFSEDTIQSLEPSDRLEFSREIRSAGWTLDLSVGEEDFFSSVNVMFWRFVALGVALAVFILSMFLFPNKFLLKPLARLQEAARSIGEGDFSARVNHDSRDEVGELAGAFNLMAEAVEERTGKLEKTARSLERREVDIRFERDRLNAVIRSMEDGLFILDATGRITLSNAAARPLIDAISRDGAGKAIHGDCAQHESSTPNCLLCIADFRNEVQGCVVTVGSRLYEMNGTVLPGPDRAIGGKVFVSRDVTLRTQQSERQAHQERLSVLGEIAAVMAHELNNPLAAISMFSQMLLTGVDESSKHHAHAEVIHRNTESCKATIRSLLDMACASESDFDTFDVNDLIPEVVQLLDPVAGRSGVNLCMGPVANDGTAFGDELQLRQAVVNLIMNAIQAIGPAFAGKVIIESVDHEHEVAIRVVDNGPGIPEEVCDQIFEPFFTTKPPGEGTGLGLSTSRRRVDAQGGRLSLCETKPGRTVFEIVMPRKRTTRSPVLPIEEFKSSEERL
jgi:signal transduction histidine kinase